MLGFISHETFKRESSTGNRFLQNTDPLNTSASLSWEGGGFWNLGCLLRSIQHPFNKKKWVWTGIQEFRTLGSKYIDKNTLSGCSWFKKICYTDLEGSETMRLHNNFFTCSLFLPYLLVPLSYGVNISLTRTREAKGKGDCMFVSIAEICSFAKINLSISKAHMVTRWSVELRWYWTWCGFLGQPTSKTMSRNLWSFVAPNQRARLFKGRLWDQNAGLNC